MADDSKATRVHVKKIEQPNPEPVRVFVKREERPPEPTRVFIKEIEQPDEQVLSPAGVRAAKRRHEHLLKKDTSRMTPEERRVHERLVINNSHKLQAMMAALRQRD